VGSGKRIAVIGAGPVGLEAALEARRLGHDAAVYEAGRVGEHFRRYGDVVLFTPFRMNSTENGRARLAASGVPLPPPEALLAAADLAALYLEPLSRLPELRGTVREGARVTGIAREGFRKPDGIAASGDSPRSGRPFLLGVEERGATRFERADVVIDASGVYGNACATGPGGLPSPGEERLGDRIERHLPSIRGASRPRYAGRRVLLVGDGYSAATALVDLAALAAEPGVGASSGAPRVHWVHRGTPGDPYPADANDPLPSRRGLAERANAAARAGGWLVRHPGATILAYDEAPGGAVRVTLRGPEGVEGAIEVDRVLALVGYRPDSALSRELHLHLCYASEAPMALASALLAAQAHDPGASPDCLSQVPHGPASLKTAEPDFFVIGAKSYGRGSNFLLTVGHEQVRDVMRLIGPAAERRSAAPMPAR